MARRGKDKEYDGPDRRAPAQLVIVNDDDNAGELLGRLLAAAGYRVTGASSHESALGCMTELLPRAVVLDLTHGGIGSNLKLLEGIRHHPDERVSSTRVVLVARQVANRVFSFQSGADAFLVRPFHTSELLDAVETVLNTPFKELPQHRRRQLEAEPSALRR